MKRTGMWIVLAIMTLAFTACASPGKTQWSKSHKGTGGDPGGNVVLTTPSVVSSGPVLNDWFPAERNSKVITTPVSSGQPITAQSPSIFIYGAKGDELAQQRIAVGVRYAASQGIQATNAGVSNEVPRGSIWVKNAYDSNISNFVPISKELAMGKKQICNPQSSAILQVASVTPPAQPPAPAQPSAPARISTTPLCPTGNCSPSTANAPNLVGR